MNHDEDSGTPPFELPANAPESCPECGGPWTRGYFVARGREGFSQGKKSYKWALVCENTGCGLGKFLGFDISPDEIGDLKLLDFNDKPKGDDVEEKKWTKTYPACRDCGTTERRHQGRGLCSMCHPKHKKAGTLDKFALKGRAKRPRRKAKTVKAKERFVCAVNLPPDVYATIERLASVFGTTPDKAATIIIRNYLTDIGVKVNAAREDN